MFNLSSIFQSDINVRLVHLLSYIIGITKRLHEWHLKQQILHRLASGNEVHAEVEELSFSFIQILKKLKVRKEIQNRTRRPLSSEIFSARTVLQLHKFEAQG